MPSNSHRNFKELTAIRALSTRALFYGLVFCGPAINIYSLTVVNEASVMPSGNAKAPDVVLLTTISLLTENVTGSVDDTSDDGLMYAL